jgi:hypothetical protein
MPKTLSSSTHELDELRLKQLLLEKAGAFGPSVATIAENLWVRAVVGGLTEAERFLKLAAYHSADRLEAASRRALFYGHSDYRTVDRLLMRRLEALPLNHYTDIDGQMLFWPQTEERSS